MLFSNMRKSVQRWNQYRTTLNELNQMTDRELSDIGISRWQIKEVAKSAL
ncbi:MAG: DUF1127 domain-containing protein [Rhodobiaceae bacterium]|nr:DUF1127 domain-containing protein [Rhodobiaceae bacterium]